MVHYLHLFPKILAGHVHAPLSSIAHGSPVVDTTIEYVHVAIAHALQSGSSEYRPSSIVVADNDQGALVRHQTPHPKFQFPTRYQAGARDMRTVVFTRFSYVNAGAGRLGIEHVLEFCRGNRLCHDVPPASYVTFSPASFPLPSGEAEGGAASVHASHHSPCRRETAILP